MHRFFFHRLGLCDEQGEAPIATSGAPAPVAAEPQIADDPVKLTIGQRLSAALASKESLQTKIVEQGNTLTEQAATITDLQAQLTWATAKVAQLEADAAEVETALHAAEAESATLKAQAKTAAQLANEKVAALGFPAAQLPAASASISAATDEEQIADLTKKLEASKDPGERGRLSQQIWDLASKGQSRN